MTGYCYELARGVWTRGGTEDEAEAVVTYGAESGWVWWARGKMGEATSYEAACRAAEDALARRDA